MEGVRGLAREINTLTLLPPSSLLPGLPVGHMQHNLEGKEAHFQSPHRLAIQDGEWVERDPDIRSYCNLFNQSSFEGHLRFCF